MSAILSDTPVVPPLAPKLTWRVLLAGAALCAIVGLVGVVIDSLALSNLSPEMAERLKWAKGEAGPASEPGSAGELRRLYTEIGRTTPMSSVRIALAGLGSLVTVCGLWMRAGDYRAWLLAGAAGGLAGFGLPMHWDSIRMVLWVAGTLAAVGGGLILLPPRWRYSLLVLPVLFHFGGTLTATTWPDTQGRSPWLTNQSAVRIYLPYFRFMYLSNAYHFYSPDPGPATQFFLLIEYEIDDPQAEGGKETSVEWVVLPERREDYKDPLGLTYFRRLSLTELASYSIPGTNMQPSWEKADIMRRRTENEFDKSGKRVSVPGATSFGEVDMTQYRQPQSPTRRAIYPSYARHVAAEYGGLRRRTDGRVLNHTVTGMKIFRVEHRILEAPQFIEYDNPEAALARRRNDPLAEQMTDIRQGGYSPYDPASYSPYYLGEYDAEGNLKDPYDPLLYWLTPMRPKPAAENKRVRTLDDYDDWMSKYARGIRGRELEEGEGFPWGVKE